ncbi:MAG: monooxygenase [Frankiales bacterium]|nr:monooxygenase [Frankiales bacterium]
MTRAQRHVEIAGGGLAGLTVATALAQRGWSVRVHERGRELREIGAGIFMWENAVRVLTQIGAADAALARAELVDNWRLYDERGRLLQDDWMKDGKTRLFTLLRTDLHRALADAARDAGVEVVTQSVVVGASPEGRLLLDTGEALQADLIVGADGVGSPVRGSLGLDLAVRDLQDGCGRHLVSRLPGDPVGSTLEYWNQGRRVGIVPVTPDQVYIYLCCPAKDLVGREKPVNVASWTASFPHLADLFTRIPDVSRWASFADVQCHRWVKDRVALVGDAASAMAPNLGQAACLAMTNGYALASVLEDYPDVPAGLLAWETRQRPVTDATQRYSRLYGKVGTRWPGPMTDVRSALVWMAGRSRRWQSRVNVAAHEGAELVSSR